MERLWVMIAEENPVFSARAYCIGAFCVNASVVLQPFFCTDASEQIETGLFFFSFAAAILLACVVKGQFHVSNVFSIKTN